MLNCDQAKRFILFFLLFALTPYSFADTIVLKNGKEYEGEVVSKDDQSVTIEYPGVGKRTYSWSDIKDIFKEKTFSLPQIKAAIKPDFFVQYKSLFSPDQYLISSRAEATSFENMLGSFLNGESFLQIEQIYDELLRTKSRYFSGTFKLTSFYDGLTNEILQSEDSRDLLFPKLELWYKQYPRSVALRVLLAQVYMQLGQEVEGLDLSEERLIEKKRRYLARAKMFLKEADELSPRDPHLYTLWLDLIKESGSEIDTAYDVFYKGKRIDKEYFPLFNSLAWLLHPKIFGEEGDLESWLETTLDLDRNEDKMLYSRIVWSVFSGDYPEDFKAFNFSWPDFREGLALLLQQNPRSLYLAHQLCFLSVQFQDGKTAELMMRRIGDAWDGFAEGLWRSKENYVSIRNLFIKQ